MSNIIEIPGFYFDPIKKRYFKTSNHVGNASIIDNARVENDLSNQYIEFEKQLSRNTMKALSAFRITHSNNDLREYIDILNREMCVKFSFKINITEKFHTKSGFNFITKINNKGYFFLQRNNGKIWKMEKNDDFNTWIIEMINGPLELVNYDFIKNTNQCVLFKSNTHKLYALLPTGYAKLLHKQNLKCEMIYADSYNLFLLLPNNTIKVYYSFFKLENISLEDKRLKTQIIKIRNKSEVVSICSDRNELYVGLRNGTILCFTSKSSQGEWNTIHQSQWNINDHVNFEKESTSIIKIFFQMKHPNKILVFTNRGVAMYTKYHKPIFLGFFRDQLASKVTNLSILHEKQLIYGIIDHNTSSNTDSTCFFSSSLLIYGKKGSLLKYFQVYLINPNFLQNSKFSENLMFHSIFENPISNMFLFLTNCTSSGTFNGLENATVLNITFSKTEITLFLSVEEVMTCMKLQFK